MVSLEPVSDKNSEIAGRVGERDWDSGPTEDPDASKSTSSLVESKGWKVVKATDLVFRLQNVSEVLARWDWACCAVHSILVRVSPLLHPIPIL